MKQAQTPQLFGALLIAAVTCCFLLVIAYKWVMLELPSTGMVPLFIAGLFVVGGFFAFVVCVMANLLLRIGPPKSRLPLSAMTWLVFVGICVGLLLDSGLTQAAR
jgi:hypothetical protein